MDTVLVNKDRLLDILQDNREVHHEEYKKAIKIWVKKARKAYAKAARKAEKGNFDYSPLSKLPMPKSYLQSYDDAIERVSLDTRQELELDSRTFSAWVQDNWNWRGDFIANSSMYTGTQVI